MNEITQIRVGKHLTGTIGLKAAIAEVAGQCEGHSDEHIGKMLREILSKHNYIEAGTAPKIKAWIEEAGKGKHYNCMTRR